MFGERRSREPVEAKPVCVLGGSKMEGEVGWGLGEGGGEASDKDPCKLKLKISHL